MSRLVAEGVSYSVHGQALVEAIDLDVKAGEIHALLGPNGSGKSTLLRLLSGDLKPQCGTITLNGKPLSQLRPVEQARQRAVLMQHHALDFPFTASEVVALGRVSSSRKSATQERELIDAALQLTDASAFAQKRYTELSGGERARVQLARIYAQIWEPLPTGHRFLLLDEPTAHLDLKHQHQCLRNLRQFIQNDVGALVVLHDLNLALAYADRVTLLSHGRVVHSGAPRAVLTAENIAKVYELDRAALAAMAIG